ncbi:amidase [Aureobasidium sp. EXF-12298]|nr:amidase [Aureobasidium sp. EXF-12298]KAI4754951.1 amidase [Aureobasidium sp. EXF-12344]KAI4772026.1 amidase [Aureobasidium sp. EXF-3400]
MAGDKTYIDISWAKCEQRDRLIRNEWKVSKKLALGNNVLEVPKTCGILTDREILITEENDAVGIVDKIRQQEYTAEEVTVAFCKRAAVAQQLTNCLTEIFFEEAIERARQLDQERAADPSAPWKPLHGLPISLKDSFKVPGFDSTIGMTYFANKPATEYSALPKLLLDLGAVLYCKTNVPQTMMTADSDNNVFGRTLNPSNLKLTAGGSSGGEGALVAMRGSVLGIGTDIAGSIRIPSICNGIYGVRPSSGIVPFDGQQSPEDPGMVGIEVVAGPMATSSRACSFFMKTIMSAQAWRYDSSCLHLRWQGQQTSRKPRIGLVLDDGVYTPFPPVRRAIREAAQKLRDAGVDVAELRLPRVADAVGITYGMFALDGCQFVQDLIKEGKEPQVESVKRVNLAAIPKSSMQGYMDLTAGRRKLQAVYHKFWLANQLDAIMLPGAPQTATRFDEWGPINYTMLWNFLDYPATIIPTGRVRESDMADGEDSALYGEQDLKNYKLYDSPETYKDAPLSVQVVGMRQEDETLAEVVGLVDTILNQS